MSGPLPPPGAAPRPVPPPGAAFDTAGAVGERPGSVGGVDIRSTQRRTVGLLVASQITGGLGIGSAVSVGGILALELSGSAAWSGGAGTALTLGAALLAIPLARLAERRGRRVSLSLGWATAGLGATTTLASAIVGQYWVMLIGMLLFGAGSAASLQSRYAAIDLAEPKSRARDLSIVVWSTTVGSVLGPNLSGPGGAVGRALGVPPLAGPFVFSIIGFVVAAALVWVLMRPDPLLVATAGRAPTGADPDGRPRPSALAVVRRDPHATLALTAIVVGHAVMVSVMTMTPVQLTHHGATLTIVGLTISLHIAGMYGLSPVFGWLADRWGRVPVILLGQGALAAAALTAGTSGGSSAQLAVGLVLLGLGWSAGLVAASTLLAESVPQEARPEVQGVSDLLMNLMGAGGAALSGVLMAVVGFGGLNAVAVLLVVPVLVLAARAGRTARPGPRTS